nr:reverse transcriptase domain-containing protein [Tanacetum cinerariifolium]
MDPDNNHGPPSAGPIPQNPVPDLRIMEEFLQAPTKGVGDAIVVPVVLANQFKLKVRLLNLVTTISFHGFANDDPHPHIRRPQGALPSNTIPNPQEDIKVITTQSGITLAGPSVPPPNRPPSSKEVERDPELTIDHVYISSSERRPFLRTAHALVDVHREELTLRVGDENLIFDVESTSKYPHKHGDDNLTPSSDPVVTSLSPPLTPFKDSYFLLEETDAFLALDDSIPPEIDNVIYDSKGDILFLDKLLNDHPIRDLPPKELKNDETKTTKSSIKEPPKL